MFNKVIITVLFSFFFLAGYGQKDKRIIINLDIDKRQVTDLEKIPFDQDFYFIGTTKDEKIKSVVVKYTILEKELSDEADIKKFKNKYYYFENCKTPSNTVSLKNHNCIGPVNKYFTIGKKSIYDGSFTFKSPKLHPNENYEFVFEFQKELGIGKTENDKLRTNILTSFNEIFSFKVGVSSSLSNKWKKTKNDVKEHIESATNDKTLYDKDNKKIPDLLKHLYIDNDEVKASFDRMSILKDSLYEKEKSLIGNDGSKPTVETIIDTLISQKITLTKAIDTVLTKQHYNDILKEPVNAVIDPKITLKNILEFVRNDYARSSFQALNNYIRENVSSSNSTLNISDFAGTNSYLYAILVGKAKLEGVTVAPAKGYDLKSVKLILSGLIQLQNLKTARGDALITAGKLNGLEKNLNEWIKTVTDMEEVEKELKAEFNNHYTVLKGVYDHFSFKSNVDTHVIIDTDKTPYIGIDFGILVAPDISSTFTLTGVNFHLRPVNRKAKFSDLRGWDEFWKRTSFSLGVAQRVGNYNDNFEKLTEVGSPYGAVGFRINRMIRLNTGVLFYELKNANPTISNNNVKATYFISASLDIELKSIFSFLSKAL